MAKATEGRKGRPGALRRGLMLYGSTAALAAALMLAEGGVGPALAQAIGPRVVPTHAAQGDFTVPGPTPTPFFEHRSDTLDIINMPRDAVLNWTVYDNAPPGGVQGNSYVNFLPEGAELRFVGNGESFTAVNRIFTTPDNAGAYRGIALQGQVTSHLFGDGPNSVGPVGGNIWFASPGGILATGSASFNVGSLLLTASDLDNFTEQQVGRSIEFIGVADAFASVVLQAGSRVTLTQPGSSFAIIAPTIHQGGEVTVDGSVLYLSAEQGVFYSSDIGEIFYQVNQASQPGNEIRHSGATTGPASIGTDDFAIYDPQTIEFHTGDEVGVLLSGSIGYAPATDASLGANGAIHLTAGAVSTAGGLALTSGASIDAPTVDLSVGAGQSLTLGSDANGAHRLFVSANEGTLAAGAGGEIDIAGDVIIVARDEAASFRVDAAGAGGNNAGGRILVGGDLQIDSSLNFFGGSPQQGGEIEATIGDGGSIAVRGSLVLSSDGYADAVGDGPTLAAGGRAVLTMTGANASLSVGESLTLSARALPFAQNCECAPPGSGFAVGGYAALTATGGTIDVDTLSVTASAEAFSGNFAEPGSDLDATGGTALVSLGDSEASFGSVSLSAEAWGARATSGVDGGAALGGSATFDKGAGGSLAIQSMVLIADATGGAGASPDGEGLPATRGGDAEGGSATVALAQNAAGLGDLDLSAIAHAGEGGSAVEYSAESGGDGGDALGGSVSLMLSGADTNLAGLVEGSLDVSSTGGSGGDGEGDFDNFAQAGDGGSGGSALGGTLLIVAADGAEFAWNLGLGISSEGGNGGRGGDQTAGDGEPSGIGRGGRGGDATGASVELVADGGAIAGDLNLEALGLAGEGGLDGFDLDGNFTGAGDFGLSTGGAIALTARDNGVSRFDVGNASLHAYGDIAGTIAISDESTDPGAGMRFGSLNADAGGGPGATEPALRVSAASNAIHVDGTAELYANSIALDFAGTGRLDVGGFTFLSTDGGDISITHADNPGVLSLHSGGAVSVYAGGDYTASEGSIVAGADEVWIRAIGSVAASDTRSLHRISIGAQGDASVGDVSAGENFELFAGRVEFDGSHGYLPSARATIGGTVAASGSVLIESGGFAEFLGGSQVLSDNDITVRTGDDILVASGASLVSDIDPDVFDSIHLLAGDINLGGNDGDLLAAIGTPIASLVVAGGLDTNGASLFLSGDAIDASASTIATGNLTVDVTDAPPFGPYSNDAGLLPADCRQGSACLGSVVATGDVAIGLDSNNGLVSLRAGAIDFDGADFEVETLDRLGFDAGNFPGNLTASGRIALRSVRDAIELTGVTLEAPTLRLRAATDLLAADATLIGADSLEIEVGNDLIAGAIIASNGLDDGSGADVFTVPGDFLVGSVTYGSGNDMRIVAGGALSLGHADPTGAAIELFATGSLFLGSTAAASGAIRLDGDSVEFDNLMGAGPVYVTAGDGGITGLPVAGRAIDTTGGIALESTGDVVVGELAAGSDLGISGATVSAVSLFAGGALGVEAAGAGSVGSFESGGYAVFSGASFDVGGGYAGSFLAIQAAEGDITFDTLGAADAGTLQASGALSGSDIVVGGALLLLGGSMAIGGAEADDGITATIGGDASFTTLGSGAGSVTLAAEGDVTGTLIAAATDVGLSGFVIAVSNVATGGNLVVDGFALNATTLSAANDMALALDGGAFIGVATAGGDLALSAGNGITAGSLAAGAALSVFSDTPAVIGEAVAGTDLTVDVSILEATSLSAGGAIDVEAGAGATMAEAVAGGSFAFTGSQLTAGVIDAGTTVDVEVALAASIDSLSSGGDAMLFGRSIDLGGGGVGGNLWAQAVEGDLSFADLSVDGDGDLRASGALLGGDVASGGNLHLFGASIEIGEALGDSGVDAAAAGAANFLSLASAGGSVSLDAGGAVAVGSVSAADTVTLAGGASIEFDSVEAGGSLFAEAGGAVAGGTVSAGNFASISAVDGITLTGLAAENSFLVSADGAVSATGVVVDGALLASGTAVTLAGAGALEVDAEATDGNVAIATTGNLTVNAVATGDIALTSTAGSVIVGGVGQLDNLGDIGAQAVDGDGAVTVTAANGITVNDSLAAGGALSMTAGGLVSLNGAATGQTIALQAGDLAIATSGSLGNANTQRISLASTSAVNLGAGASGGFAVDAGEFARIQSGGDLMVTALAGIANGAGTLTVGSLTVNAGSGGQVGSAGTFGLTASGLLDVGDTLSIARAGNGATLMLTGDAVDLDYANAAVSVLDSANAATGRIHVNGRLITSLSASAAADIAGDTAAEIDQRLGLADVVREIGLFRTANLALEGRDAILIQNSGGAAADDRRGLNVGALTVTGAPNGQTLVVINGVVNNATGNNAAQNAIVTNALAAGSSMNGCLLADIAGCFAVVEPQPPLITAPDSVLFGTSDLIKEEDDDEVEDGVADGQPEAPPIDTTRIDDPAGLPMIDDPVTGAGNEDLWQPPED